MYDVLRADRCISFNSLEARVPFGDLDFVKYVMAIDAEFEAENLEYDHARPFTKESLLYRELFEKYYPNQSQMIIDFWMPNRDWDGCNVNDPSARVLSNYGASGK